MYYDAIVEAYYKEKTASKTAFFGIDRSFLENGVYNYNTQIINTDVSLFFLFFLIWSPI